MREESKAWGKAWIGIAAAVAALAFASPSFAGTFQVNVTSDGTTLPPDCNVLGQTGTCTLRDAINLANLDPGPNTIDFAIGGSPPQIITLTSALPALTKPTTINGASQTGYAGTPLIVLDGSNLTSGFGLELDGAGGGVIALDLANFQNGVTAALYLHGGGAAVTGNYIGVDSSGTGPVRNQVGIQADTANNTIGGTTTAARNVISGNGLGILITGAGATANVIQGNYVGLDAAGTNGIFGSGEAITVDGGASGTTIGGTTVAARNVISGQGQNAITFGAATGNVVKGNFIGPIADDSSAIGNDIAVQFDAGADNNTIGSAGAGANVMAGSGDVAILVLGGKNNAIEGNLIGTDLGGTPFSFGNDQGVRIISGDGNTFSYNRISTSNQQGIEIDAGGNTFTANRIDSNDNGGIIVNAGGSTIGPGNTIVDSQGFGIQVTAGNSTRITRNSIDGTSGGKGIQLFESVNNNAIAPVLTAAAGSGSNIQIQGTLDSTVSTDFAVEFFRSPGCNSSTFGEGAAYLGTTTAATDGAGHLAFDSSFPAVGSGSTITATATDSVGNTSEFSACATMSGTASSVFTVTATDDESGACTIAHCSLREAIEAANAATGTTDAIAFNIATGGLQTIQVPGPLPTITDPVTIDGTTQPGTLVNAPGIELDGGHDTPVGLQIDAGGSTVRGLVIGGFSSAGIVLQTAGSDMVAGNYIGTDAAGQASNFNGYGITVSSANNVIGGIAGAADRNVISGNGFGGVHVLADGNTIEGNYIGTTASGATALGNADEGIFVQAQNTTIGGTAAGAGNVISGSTIVTPGHGEGIGLYGANNLVQGNLIGTNATGTAAIPNAQRGVLINGTNGNTVGGTSAAARNVVSGNSGAGIEEANGGSNNTIAGNYVGLQPDGTTSLGNGNVGIQIAGGSGNAVGGSAAGAGNVVSSNVYGVVINGLATSTVVQRNLIGTDKTGSLARGNTAGGLDIDASNSVIGGTAPGLGNTIAFNLPAGIRVNSGAGNAIRGNSIFSNTFSVGPAGLGIDLGGDYVTPNDTGDGDSGANNLQNYPVLSSATAGGGSVTINGDLNSVASTLYHVDFYDNPTCDPSGNGEGQTYLGSQDATTDSSGNRSFTAIFTAVVPTGHSVTATATDPSGNTSEFSACATVAVADPTQTGPNFTVNTNADPGDGTCSVSDCTLREAINAANGQSGANTINFDIFGAGVHTIQPTSLLPDIVDPVTINGYSQPGSAVNTSATVDNAVLHIELTGLPGRYPGCDCSAAGLKISAPSTVRGLVVNGGFDLGIEVQNAAATGTQVAGNFIGTNSAGTASGGALFDGVYLSLATNVTVGGPAVADRNVVSGNSSATGGVGVELTSSSTNNFVQGNLIGTNAAGTGAVPNGVGVQVGSGGLNTTITGNVVSGNTGIGIWGSDQTATTTVITLNRIGTDAAGAAALGNGGDGILFQNSSGNTVGGPTALYGNLISGNGGHGVEMRDSNNNFVQGNYVGVNLDGTAAIPNTIDGIAVDGGSGNRIGGITPGVGNLTSGNHNQGISIFQVNGQTAATGNIVYGNRAGLNAAGNGSIPNGGDGIRAFHASNTIIGGVLAGQANESAGNGANGVAIVGAASTGNSIRGNSIHDNGILGIELTAGDNYDGLTPNDAGDADAGANNLQNFPVLATATVNAASTQITGSLDSALGSYAIDFYASTTCSVSGNGEGARWLGSSVVKTGTGPLIAIDTGTHITASVSPGEFITATATDSAGNTSEFSTCLVAEAGLTGLALTSDEASVPAGAANIPLSSVPPATLGLLASAPIPNSPIPNSAVGAAPIPNSPIPNSPIPNSPIANSPIANSPIANSGVDGIPASILATIPLSSIPIDWTPIFAGTVEANVPTPSLTLLDVFNVPAALTRFNALPLSQLHLEGSLLRGVRFSSLLYGGITIDKIPPYTPAGWCLLLSSCTGIDVTKVTVLGLDVAGLLDATSLGAVTVGQVRDFTSATSPIPNSPIPNSPIPNSPIANSPIANSSVPLTVIGSVVIGTLAVPSNVVDCTKLTSCLTKTLADAANANAIKPTATYQDLLRPNANGVYPLANVNFNAFAIALIGIENLPWESWPFDGFQEFAGTGNVVHYHLTAPVQCTTNYTLRVVLPRGFLVKRGSSSLAVGTGAAIPIADPATNPITGATWALQPLSCTGVQAVRLDFQGLAGFRLGEQSATAQLIVGASVKTANAPITVTQNNEPDSNPATAPAIQPNTLAVGHIPTSDDLDWRSLSTTGLARGTKVTVYLRPPVGTDLDVYLTKPSSPTLLSSTSPIPNSPIPNSPIPNSPLPDNGGSLGATTDNPQPEGLQDAPIANSAIASAGITRGDGVEVAQVVLGGDENGPVKILVAGYNGAHSPDAYTLRVKVVTPPQLPACPARTFAFPTVTNVGTLPASIPSTKQNLFIMNFGATAKAYGLTAANSLLTKLNTVAARADVNGAVLQVDGDAAVRTAKAAWDASPCSTAAANDVVRKINAVVARYRAQATGVQSITIVGGDELIPMARIADLTTDANEASAVGDLIFTTNGLTRGNALFASEFLGNTLTDDAYTAGTTIPWFGRELYLPQIAGGRLVETPTEIMGQLDQYISSNGILAPTTAVVSGYDFMKDEAGQISTELRSTTARNVSVDTTSPQGTLPLIGDAWTKTDLQPYFSSSTAQRGIVSANGHYNHWEAAPASRPAASPPPLPLTSADLISTAVLPLLGATQLQDAGSILFTMGCHAGLNVSNTFPSGTTPERLRDWAQAWSQNKVAVYVANTGYGYGDYDAIVLSERLMAMFAHNLASDGSIGRKLVLAKQQYFGSIASYDPYAEKALAEATFYGLPFYRVGIGAEASDPALVAHGDDPAGTGVQVATIGINPALTPHALTPHPTARGTYWSADGGVEYLKDRPIEPRLSQEVTTNDGLRAHGVRITELTTHDELNIDPLIATPMIDLSAHEPEALVKNITFPATFAAIDHWTAFGANHDSLVVDAGQTRPGTGAGETQRLVDHIKLDVLYSTSNDFAPPLLSSVGSIVDGGTATLFAHTSDSSGVARVVAFFTEGGAVWKFVTLHLVSGDLYTGTAAVTVPKIESAFSSQDTAGNVGYSTDKGTLFTSLTGDSQPPEVTIASPINNATYTFGQSVPASFACSDDGGVSSCQGDPVANGAVVDTSTLGQHSFSVTATDLTGNTVTVTVKYTVAIYTFKGFFSPIHNPPDLNVVKPGSAVPIKFSLSGNQGLLIFAPNSPASRQISCDPNVPQDPVPTSTSGGSTLSYDASSDTYTYSWKTDSAWRGTCRQLVVTLRDGTPPHLANFKFSN